MNLLEALFLGLVQGLTEFLPVSSSGHLSLAQHFLGLRELPLSFDILLHLATLLAIIIILFPEIKELSLSVLRPLIKGKIDQIPKLFWLLIIASLPAAVAGIFLDNFMELIFDSVRFFSIGFLFTGILLLLADKVKNNIKNTDDLTLMDSLKIGLFQALAILPSISRSGSTIAGSLFLKLNPKDAFNFSFLLSIPAILGAFLLNIKDLALLNSEDIMPYTLGFMAAFVSGFVALKFVRRTILANKLYYFAYYCIALSVALLFIL